jgi:hypothetical protein
MAKPHRMFVVTLTALVCALFPAPLQAHLAELGCGLPVIALAVISAGCVITAGRRLRRAGLALGARTPAT